MPKDQTLLQRARSLDNEALAEIYDTYSQAIYRYALRLLGDVDTAEDCVAETFNRFLLALKHGKGPNEHLQAYLYRIAHNWITDSYRRQPLPTLPLDCEMCADEEEEPSQVVAHELEYKRVRAALTLLTPDQRQVMVLKYLEEMSNAEVALILGKPVGAIKALQHRAIEALHRILLPEKERVL